jgi:hypothetical protein
VKPFSNLLNSVPATLALWGCVIALETCWLSSNNPYPPVLGLIILTLIIVPGHPAD